ncbi:hypothetical protein EV714DRAFT_248083, partial [Schizophyllum commune]
MSSLSRVSPTMSRTSSTPSSLSALGYQPSCFPCAPECTLATHSPTHHRGKTGREFSSGDIRTTTISLLAPFYEALKGYRSVKLDDKSLARTSTFRSQPSRSSSRRPSVASGSCASGRGGPKRRPCVIVDAGAATAKVILMGTFEGAYIDELHPILQEYLAILFSRDSTYEEERFTKDRPAHMHSTPEWAQKPKHLGHLQYIVPLRHEIDLHAATERWKVLRTGDGGSTHLAGAGDTEGYYMDGENMSDLIGHAEVMYDRLRMRCQRRTYRHALRQALRERGKAAIQIAAMRRFKLDIRAPRRLNSNLSQRLLPHPRIPGLLRRRLPTRQGTRGSRRASSRCHPPRAERRLANVGPATTTSVLGRQRPRSRNSTHRRRIRGDPSVSSRSLNRQRPILLNPLYPRSPRRTSMRSLL